MPDAVAASQFFLKCRLSAPLSFLYCEDDDVAALLLALNQLGARERKRKVHDFLGQVTAV
jgi:hypothetical protein